MPWLKYSICITNFSKRLVTDDYKTEKKLLREVAGGGEKESKSHVLGFLKYMHLWGLIAREVKPKTA